MKKLLFVLSFVLFLGVSDVWAQCKNGGQIRFPRGRTSTVIKGRVSAAKNICYKFRARGSQRLIAHLTSPSKRVRFTVIPDFYDAMWLEGADDVTDWEGELANPANDDYIISVGIPKGRGSDTFTLEITIR